jgi:hypothetical protein
MVEQESVSMNIDMPRHVRSSHRTTSFTRSLAPRIGRLLSICALAVALPALVASAPANAAPLVGNPAIAATLDGNSAGMAEAFLATAGAGGTATQMAVYLDAGSTATKVILGVLTDANGHPGTLMTQGAINAPVKGTWNTLAIAPVAITSGRSYWLAILAPAGAGIVKFRDAAGGGRSETSSSGLLSALPTAWTSGTTYPDGALSMTLSAGTASGPVLATTPSSLSFAAVAGGANPAPAALGLANGGAGTLSFTAATNAPWLAIAPASGTAPATAQVSVSIAGLAAGAYAGQVTLSSGTPAAISTVPVTLTLSAPGPAISVTPALLSFSATAGGANPPSSRLAISSANAGALPFTLTSNQPWLTAFPSSGTTPTSERIRVSATGLSAGSYIGQLMVIPTQAGAGGAVAVPVTFTVNSAVPAGHSVSGTLSPASLGAGALVSLSGAAVRTALADGAGNYLFTSVADGSYSIAPSHAGTAFSPSAQGVVVNGADVGGVNFTATSNATTLFFDDFAGTSLGSAWTVVQRRGPSVQGENECNTAGAVGVADSILTITTSATPAICGDAVTAPTRLPYTSGDIQWTSLNFTYGTVEVRAKFPPKNTGTWPAFWLLGANCQAANLINGSEATAFDGCPAQGTPGYREIDAVECDGRSWCHMVVAQGSAGWSNMCAFPVDANWHVFRLTWNAAATSMAVDGTPTGCSFPNTGLDGPMFLIVQTQTTTAGGLAGLPNAANLPTTFQVDYVKVTSP